MNCPARTRGMIPGCRFCVFHGGSSSDLCVKMITVWRREMTDTDGQDFEDWWNDPDGIEPDWLGHLVDLCTKMGDKELPQSFKELCKCVWMAARK